MAKLSNRLDSGEAVASADQKEAFLEHLRNILQPLIDAQATGGAGYHETEAAVSLLTQVQYHPAFSASEQQEMAVYCKRLLAPKVRARKKVDYREGVVLPAPSAFRWLPSSVKHFVDVFGELGCGAAEVCTPPPPALTCAIQDTPPPHLVP